MFVNGWSVDLEFCDSIEHLFDISSSKRYDRIDIATSDCFSRTDVRDNSPQLAQKVLDACPNDLVELSFGGRAFWEDDTAIMVSRCSNRPSVAKLNKTKTQVRFA